MVYSIPTTERTFSIEGGDTLIGAAVTERQTGPGIRVYHVTLEYGDITNPVPTRVAWEEPMLDFVGYWAPGSCRDRCIPQGWYPHKWPGCLLDGTPLFALFRTGGENYRTVCISECEQQSILGMFLANRAQNDYYATEVQFFDQLPPSANVYEFDLRIDSTRRPLPDCVGEASLWMQGYYPNPECADGRPNVLGTNGFAGDLPLFSSWYACFQEPLQSDLEASLPIAQDLGFRAMIIDDGWSYDGAGGGSYAMVGTWEISKVKFPDFKAFMREAHRRGVQVALWFPISLIGKKDPHYEAFRDRLIHEETAYGVLDPRFPEVRTFIVESLRNMVEWYDLDGLKLDFLTDFNRPTVPARPGTDHRLVNDAVTDLLHTLDLELKRIRPHCMIEYRQNYVSPSVIRHCNMLRVCDCANDFVTNRLNTVDLRMLRYPVAIHSDMLLWSRMETPENVAVMLENVMFGVPQISVLFHNVDPVQLPAVKAFLSYWTEHRELLLWGKISVEDPEQNYSRVWVEDDDFRIVAQYTSQAVRFDGKTTDVFQANRADSMILDAQYAGVAEAYDCTGRLLTKTSFMPGLVGIALPRGGRLRLSKQ